MNVDQFIAESNGVHIDEDGYYGAQCWDLVAKYARVVVGCPSFPTGSGGAEGLFRLFQDPIGQYFDRIPNDASNPNQLPQKGDVIVWQASFSPPYGHTALVVSADSSGPTVLEQNGNNPGGAAYIKKRSWVGVSGWLRPKTKQRGMMMVDRNLLTNYYQTLLGRAPDDGGFQTWVGQPADVVFQELILSDEYKARQASLQALPAEAVASVQKQLTDLQKKFDELVLADGLKDKRIADLQKQVPSSTTVEQPVVGKSLWQVIGDFLSQFKKG
jgi:hypothetical protein